MVETTTYYMTSWLGISDGLERGFLLGFLGGLKFSFLLVISDDLEIGFLLGFLNGLELGSLLMS